MASQHPDIEKVLFTQEDIDGIVSRLGEQITRDYAGKDRSAPAASVSKRL